MVGQYSVLGWNKRRQLRKSLYQFFHFALLDFINDLIHRCGFHFIDQVFVACLNRINQLHLQRPLSIPGLAGRNHVNIDLGSIVTDKSLEQLVNILEFGLEFLATFVGIFAKHGQRSFMGARGMQLNIDLLGFQQPVKVWNLSNDAN